MWWGWISVKLVGGICSGILLLVSGTCHSHDCISHHPWRIISPFNSMSTPCFWKMTVHPASHSSLTARSKLCCRFLRRKANHAGWGSFASQRHIVVSICVFPPLGIVRQKFRSWILATLAGAWSCTNNVDEAESIKAVACICLGLAKLGLVMLMVLNKLSTALQ